MAIERVLVDAPRTTGAVILGVVIVAVMGAVLLVQFANLNY